MSDTTTPEPTDADSPGPTDADSDSDSDDQLDGFERDLDAVGTALDALDADDLAAAESVVEQLHGSIDRADTVPGS